jgi:hypothetical protein
VSDSPPASEPRPEPGVEPAAASTEVAPEGASSAAGAEDWVPAPTLGDRLSPYLRRAFKITATGVLTVGIGTQLLWVIPTYLVSRRAGFEALRESVEADRGYQQALWGPVQADAWPETYLLPEDPEGLERYTLVARGPGGVIRVEGHVKGGEVVHMRSRGVADWRSAWRARKQTR